MSTSDGTAKVMLVPEGLDGMRLDQAVARITGLSRTRASDLADEGHIVLGGQPAGRSTKVVAGQLLEVTIPDAPVGVQVVPEEVSGIGIVHDDDDIVVVDKPVGVAAHPSLGWEGPSVVEHLAAAGFRISTSGAPERQGIVQRLDVGTSGLMVVAKSEYAYTVLKQAFRSRQVDKTYHACVQGHPDPSVGTVDAPIGRHPGHDWKMAITSSGRASVTHYRVIEMFRGASLLEVGLETGRTHQIRVHMAAVKHPCVGDPLYGADPVMARRLGLDRQWLHAVELGLIHPGTGEPVVYRSDYPADLQHALDQLRG